MMMKSVCLFARYRQYLASVSATSPAIVGAAKYKVWIEKISLSSKRNTSLRPERNICLPVRRPPSPRPLALLPSCLSASLYYHSPHFYVKFSSFLPSFKSHHSRCIADENCEHLQTVQCRTTMTVHCCWQKKSAEEFKPYYFPLMLNSFLHFLMSNKKFNNDVIT